MTHEYATFNKAMGAILRADPKSVKEQMEAETKANAAERRAKGEHKRGRKKAANRRPSASVPASSAKD
jgi:hypothetical protein